MTALAHEARPAADPASSLQGPFARLAASRQWVVAGAMAFVVGLVLQRNSWWNGLSWASGTYLVWSVALPCALLAVCPRRWVVRLALILTAIPLILAVLANVRAHDPTYLQIHDGGVQVTDAAAGQVLHGVNPYTANFHSALGSQWSGVVVNGHLSSNPVTNHFPYLPGAFLVNAPFRAAADLFGLAWDARLLYLGIVLATLFVVAGLRVSPFARAATICAIGGALLRTDVAWGTNDAPSACLFLIALLVAGKRPRLAGLLLALAISFKFLFLLPLLPLAMLLARRDGWASLRRFWTLPAALAASILPFFLVAPKAFIDDALLFNLGLTKDRYPASGVGLPVLFPGVFHGVVLGLATVVCAVGGIGGALWLVRRWPVEGVAAVAGGLALLGVLVPARTFQPPYVTLLGVLFAGAWLLVDRRSADSGLAEPALAGGEPLGQLRTRGLGHPADT